MSSFRLIKGLLPRSKTWSLTADTIKRRVFDGYAAGLDHIREELGAIVFDADAERTANFDQWVKQFGLLGATTAQNVALYARAWLMDRFMSPEWLQEELHAAGFGQLFVHESWDTELSPYDLSGAEYSGDQFDITGEGSNPTGLAFGKRGSRMYVLFSNDTVQQYDLSDPYDITTAQPAATLDVSSEDTGANAVRLSPNGDRVFVLGNQNDSIYAYDLSDAWEVESATLAETGALSAASVPTSFDFGDDGTTLYVLDSSTDVVDVYDLGAAWDVTSPTHAPAKALDVSGQATSPQGLAVAPGEDRLFVSDDVFASDTIYQYELVTPGDPSTASYDGVSVAVSGVGGARGLAFGGNGGVGVGYDNGTELFLAGGNNVARYRVATFHPRDPTPHINQPQVGTVRCGEDESRCGNEGQRCNAFLVNDPLYLVWSNNFPIAPPIFPTTEEHWRGVYYVGGETFPNKASFWSGHRKRLEELIYKLKRPSQWAVLLIDQSDAIATQDDKLLTTQDGRILLEQ